MKPQNDILDNFALWKENVKLKRQLADKRQAHSYRMTSLEFEIRSLRATIKRRDRTIKNLRASRAPSP